VDILEHVKSILKRADKQYHIFFLKGKISVSKLANFPEIAMFGVFTCPETFLLDFKEFMKPPLIAHHLNWKSLFSSLSLFLSYCHHSLHFTSFQFNLILFLFHFSDLTNVQRKGVWSSHYSHSLTFHFTQSIKRNAKAKITLEFGNIFDFEKNSQSNRIKFFDFDFEFRSQRTTKHS